MAQMLNGLNKCKSGLLLQSENANNLANANKLTRMERKMIIICLLLGTKIHLLDSNRQTQIANGHSSSQAKRARPLDCSQATMFLRNPIGQRSTRPLEMQADRSPKPIYKRSSRLLSRTRNRFLTRTSRKLQTQWICAHNSAARSAHANAFSPNLDSVASYTRIIVVVAK